MPAVLGDFLAAANEHLEAAVVVGDGQLPQLPEVVRDLHRLVAVMSHHLDDLAPCDEVGASNWDGLHVWERAVIDAGVAMRAAVACLRRARPGPVTRRVRRRRGGRAIWPPPPPAWRLAGICCTLTMPPILTG